MWGVAWLYGLLELGSNRLKASDSGEEQGAPGRESRIQTALRLRAKKNFLGGH
jgi:hypothetical protein